MSTDTTHTHFRMEQNNFLIPKHRKISKKEIQELLKKHSLTDISKLPVIKKKDFALATLDIDIDDVIEITRKSFVGESKYYRRVIN